MRKFFGTAFSLVIGFISFGGFVFNATLAMTIYRNMDTMNGRAIPALIVLSVGFAAIFVAMMLED